MPDSLQQWRGRLTVRTLPEEENAEYEKMKPSSTVPLSVLVPKEGHRRRIRKFKSSDLDSSSKRTTFDIELQSITDESKTISIRLNRDSEEPADRAFQRMGLTIIKRTLPKQKRGQKQVKPQVSYSFSMNNQPVDFRGDESLDEMFRTITKSSSQSTSTSMEFTIDDNTIPFQLCYCPPTVALVQTFEQFRTRIFVGIPLHVEVEVFFATDCCIDWFVGGDHVESDVSFVPTDQHLGKSVSVMVTPCRDDHDGAGCSEAYKFKHVVEPLPENALLSIRPHFTEPRSPEQQDCLRVMSYNILADVNAFSHMAQTSFYPYCDNSVLERQRRFPLILHEILAYQPDIVCLQEVDSFAFKKLLRPALRNAHYQGFYSTKDSSGEGCAIFWSLSRFEMVPKEGMHNHLIRGLFDQDPLEGWQSMLDIHDLLDKHTELKRVVENKLGHLLQTVTLTLRNKDKHKQMNDRLVVGNTHLFFHPMASHIRLLQMYACCHQLEKERQSKYPIVFCGDFNSSPRSGAARLIFERKVQPNTGITDQGTTWEHLHTFSWDPNEETEEALLSVDPPTIELPESFPTIISGYSNTPEFTHYIQGFQNTLDYVLASGDFFQSNSSASMPSEEMVAKDVGMPSEVFPSDHISLVCDLTMSSKSRR